MKRVTLPEIMITLYHDKNSAEEIYKSNNVNYFLFCVITSFLER